MALLMFACIAFAIAGNHLVFAQDDWTEPYFTAGDGVDLAANENNLLIKFKESEKEGFIIGTFLYTGSGVLTLDGPQRDYFKLDTLVLSLKKEADFENDLEKKLSIRVTQGDFTLQITVEVQNVNDNPIYITGNRCEQKENNDENYINEECVYTITDADGLSEHLEFGFSPDRFRMSKEPNELKGQERAELNLKFLKSEDFETENTVALTWTAKDEEYKEEGEFAELFILVKIIDMPDMPTEWNDYIGTISIKEEESVTRTLKARDGDIQIAETIQYKLECEPQQCPHIELVGDQLKIGPYILDDPLDNSFSFDVTAFESHIEASQTVYIQIMDINNNKPEISVSPLEFGIEEETNTLPPKLSITISDKDAGKYGTYTVSLESEKLPNIKEIMQIIPESGYQTTQFNIIITDAEKLDYDDENMDVPAIVDVIIKVEPADPEHLSDHTVEETIKITLKDLNDESPIWKEPKYEVKVLETFGRTEIEEIKIDDHQFFATDNDKEEVFNTITYELGPAAQQLLTLETTTPEKEKNLVLKTKTVSGTTKQLFDYEREKSIIIPITATDGLNTATVQLTINLDDVNDEMPTLDADTQTADIKEKSDIDTKIDINLESNDADESSELKYGIDEGDDDSYVLKRGKKLMWSDHRCISINEETGELKLTQEPDYNVFDTIYLQVYVEDLKAEVPKPQKTKLRLIINIENIPDMPLEFDDNTFIDNAVVEHSEKGLTIGVIKATDPDAPGWKEIVFSLKEKPDTPVGLVSIHPDSGKLTVSGEIDADFTDHNPKGLFDLKYEVTATVDDQIHRFEVKDLTISIKDIDDNKPKPENNTFNFSIEEHSDVLIGSDGHIKVTDSDRDEKNSQFECRIDIDSDIKDIYAADTDETGCIIKIVNGKKIERDGSNGREKHTFNLIAYNPNTIVESSIIPIEIEIKDINDNYPSITTDLQFTANEEDKEQKVLGVITGVDEDSEEKNIKILYELINIEKHDGDDNSQLTLEDFEIEKIGGQLRNSKFKIKKNLETFYGTYTLTFKATNDLADNKWYTDNNTVTLVVEKYNYKSVSFVGALANPDPVIILSDAQEANKPLHQHGPNAPDLENFEATDNQGNKYALEFKIIDNCLVDGQDLFKLLGVKDQTAQLQLTSAVNLPDRCILTITAQSIGATPHHDEAKVEVKIIFLDNDAGPVFEQTEFSCEWVEMDIGPLKCQLPEAKQYTETRHNTFADTNIKYYISESVPEGAYEITDPMVISVNVAKEIDLNELGDEKSWFKVEASYNTVPSDQPKPESVLLVNVNIEDINNHPPVFSKESDIGILLVGLANKGTNVELKADDPDKNDVLTFKINWDTYDADGNIPSKDTKPFEIRKTNSREGELLATFTVLASMSGRVEFDVIVEDSDDENKHTDTMHVTLYVIADVHLCSLIFENNLQDVEEKREILIEVLAEQFKYTVGISDVKLSSLTTRRATYEDEDENVDISSTEVIAYFIDTENKVGIESDVIKAQINNLNFYAQLRKAFLEYSLLMTNVIIPADAESLEETYKIALIVVSAICGVLIIGLIGFFTYKIRSTNSRINRLAQAEVRRPTMIPNLPGANRRATQVVNPNVTHLEEDNVSNDLSFTKSPRESFRNSIDDEDDDENFIGVEKSDIFKIATNY